MKLKKILVGLYIFIGVGGMIFDMLFDDYGSGMWYITSIGLFYRAIALFIGITLIELFFCFLKTLSNPFLKLFSQVLITSLSCVLLFTAGHSVLIVSCGKGCPSYTITERYSLFSYRDALILNSSYYKNNLGGNNHNYTKIFVIDEGKEGRKDILIGRYINHFNTREYIIDSTTSFSVYRGLGVLINLQDDKLEIK
jgi:hypothetical protein